jgi:hypothetical protein
MTRISASGIACPNDSRKLEQQQSGYTSCFDRLDLPKYIPDVTGERAAMLSTNKKSTKTK